MPSEQPSDGDSQSTDGDEGYAVVICPDEGVSKEHAELMRKELIADGYHDHAVEVRKKGGSDV